MVNSPVDKTQWKVLSWRTTSKDELAKTIPVKPPTVNKKIKAKAHDMAGELLILPPWRVAR